jgi:hypothetical protein
VKVAVSVCAPFIAIEHVCPEHAPLKPANCHPDSGVAVSWTVAPDVNDALQVEPQSIPAGFDTTLPDPASMT